MSPLQHPLISIGTLVAVVAIVAGLFFLGGCANTYANCKQTIVATDAGVVSASTLRETGVITADDARPISIAAHTLLAAETSWKISLDAGDKSGAATAARAASSALGQLSAQLLALQARKQLPLNTATGRDRLQLAHFGPTQDPARKGIGETAAIIAIVQIAADLTPQIVAWINAASASGQVTSTDVQGALTALARDLVTLDTAIGQ